MKKLTLEKLNSFPLASIIATNVLYEPILSKEIVRWVAVVGRGIHDWAIYYQNEDWDLDRIKDYGDKITIKSLIQYLVPCTEEVLKMYRR